MLANALLAVGDESGDNEALSQALVVPGAGVTTITVATDSGTRING